MEVDVVTTVERVGSLGLLGWLLIWATGTMWPRVSAHLDAVNAKLDRIGDQLGALRADFGEVKGMVVGEGLEPSRSAAGTTAAESTTAGGHKVRPYTVRKSSAGSKA